MSGLTSYYYYEDRVITPATHQYRVYHADEADKVISTIRAERDEYRYNLSCARNEIHNLSMSMREDVKRIADKDKVIAEKDKEIQRLENLCESYRIDCDNLAIREANACKEIERDNKQIRHQKYKRCVAMAEWFDAEADVAVADGYYEDMRLYQKWHNRWLELAEKFKEAKCR